MTKLINRTLTLVSLVLCGALINTGTVNANCFDEFVDSNPDATELGCCENSDPDEKLTVPASITQLTKLTKVDLVRCGIEGTFPTAGWDNLVDLEELYVTIFNNGEDKIFNIPATLDLSSLPRMTALHLSRMSTNGEIPEWILTMTNLKTLSLFQCNLKGTLPLSLRRLPNLLDLRLQFNSLTGPIPEWFLDFFSKLEVLDLLKNTPLIGSLQGGFTGTISESIGRLNKMQYLELGGNAISGMLPSEMGLMTELTQLSVAYNQLTGYIPPSFGQLVKMQRIDFQNNALTGSLPAELSALTDLGNLNVEATRLHGPLPDGIFIDAELTHLAPGADCSSPANQTMCTWGDDKCADGVCEGRTDTPTTSPTTPTPTSSPTSAPTLAPTVTDPDDQTLLFVGVGVGCLVAGFIAALCFTGRCKRITSGSAGANLL